MPSSRLPDKLLAAMLSHRQKVLRQVSGLPENALDALWKKLKRPVLQPGAALEWKEDDATTLSRVDRSLVDFLMRQGFVSRAHHIEQRDQDLTMGGPHAIPNHAAEGTVVMAGNRMGDFEEKTPLLAPQETADRWRQKDDESAVYRRWFVLLHELAHCEYPSMPRPFNPTPKRHDKRFVCAMNRWVAGPLSLSSQSARSLLNEGHSDAFAAMVLLQLTNHAPKALAVIQEIMRSRIRVERKVAARITRNLDEGAHLRGDFVDEHCTAAVLYRLLGEREQWKGAPPKKVRELAVQYASDALIERLSLKHPLGKFHDALSPSLAQVPVGRVLSETLVAPSLDTDRMVNALFVIWYAQANGQHPQAWFQSQDQDHPLLPVLKEAFQQSKDRGRIDQVRELYESSGTEDAFVLALRHGSAWASKQMASEFKTILQKVCAPTSPAWRRAQQAYEYDMGILSQGLGLPVRERSHTISPQDLQDPLSLGLRRTPRPSGRQGMPSLKARRSPGF